MKEVPDREVEDGECGECGECGSKVVERRVVERRPVFTCPGRGTERSDLGGASRSVEYPDTTARVPTGDLSVGSGTGRK